MLKIREYEMRVALPDGLELVGVKTDGEEVVIVCRPQESDIRVIGFCASPPGEGGGEESAEEGGMKGIGPT